MNEPLHHLTNLDLATASKTDLRHYTYARIGLAKTGFAIAMKEVLAFRAAHAAAKDALYTPFETAKLTLACAEMSIETLEIFSAVQSKGEYLQRPDLGRVLKPESAELLEAYRGSFDIAITVSDGLSALAANQHAVPLLALLYPKLVQAGYRIAPLLLLHKGRVAASDQVGQLLNAKLSLILVGERPGLSSPDSLGAYLTYAPRVGNTDETRNCVSNIRPQGLYYALASEKLFYLMTNALRRQLSGVGLKDEMGRIG